MDVYLFITDGDKRQDKEHCASAIKDGIQKRAMFDYVRYVIRFGHKMQYGYCNRYEYGYTDNYSRSYFIIHGGKCKVLVIPRGKEFYHTRFY